jgi:LrgA family
MLAGFTLLLLCQLAGEALVKISDLPVPGPVVGMVLLTGLLASRTPLPGALAARRRRCSATFPCYSCRRASESCKI